MSDPRLSVLLDLLAELGGEGRQGIAEALAARPELWLSVPRDVLVALPWVCPRGSSLRAYRPAAGAASTLLSRAAVPRLLAAKVSTAGRGLAIEAELRPVAGWTAVAPRVGATLEEAQAAADAALVAAGWELL